MNHGLGYATSPDGLNRTRDSGNPIFHKDDIGYPKYHWRQNRSYTPMVLRAGTLWLMWYSGEDGGGKTIGCANRAGKGHDHETTQSAPSLFPQRQISAP
ncbi:MAG TPA: hypothetical protein VM075_02590 [Anaerolineae bacterium]|nr:hypothetical protein [Anaerolineae bacterium]